MIWVDDSLEVLLRGITEWMLIINRGFTSREIGTKARGLITPVELIEINALEQVMFHS